MTAHAVPESVRRLWGIPAQNDLPPSWDGVPVTWAGWRDEPQTSLAYHLPLDHLACDQCGSLAGRLHNAGTRPATEPREGWPHPVRDIFASRCSDCGHDTVTDTRTNETWDLDPDDYSDAGSTEHKETLF